MSWWVDETIYEYEPKDHTKLKRQELESQANVLHANLHDALAPKRYIKRKPHPNGLLVYHASFETQFGSYLYDLEPDLLVHSALNPQDALVKMATRMEFDIGLHLTTDAGFTDYSLFPYFLSKNIHLTSSFNSACKLWLYEFLLQNCPPQRAVAIVDAKGVVWSLLHSIEDNKEAVHFVASSAFVAPERPPTVQLRDCKTRDIQTLSTMSDLLLGKIASKLSVDAHANRNELVHLIYDKLIQEPVPEPPGLVESPPSARMTRRLARRLAQQIPPSQSVPDSNSIAAAEDEKKSHRRLALMALVVEQLKVQCKQLKLSFKGRKGRSCGPNPEQRVCQSR